MTHENDGIIQINQSGVKKRKSLTDVAFLCIMIRVRSETRCLNNYKNFLLW